MADEHARSDDLTTRGRASRDRIVRAATRLMLERGVAATSIDDVLQEADASKSQLYHYFANKRDLVNAVISRAEDLVLAAQQPHLSSLDSWAAIDAWFDQIVALKQRHGCETGCPLGTLTSELAAVDDHACAELDAAFGRWQAHLTSGLTAMRDRGELRADANVEALAIATIASLQGGLLLAKASRTTRPLRIALDAARGHLRTHAATASNDRRQRNRSRSTPPARATRSRSN